MRALYPLLALLLSATLCLSSCNDGKPLATAAEAAPAVPAVELASISGSSIGLPADQPVDVKLEFAKATPAGQPGRLSNLQFNFSAACANAQLASESLTLSADKPQSKSQLDAQRCMVDVSPQIDPLVNLDSKSYGAYGGYRIAVRSSCGEALCSLEVNKAGELSLLKSGSKYHAKLMLAAPKDGTWRYNVYAKGDGKHTPVMAVEYTGKDFVSQDIKDKSGNSYAYRFPKSALKIYSAEQAIALNDDKTALKAYTGGAGSSSCGGGGGG